MNDVNTHTEETEEKFILKPDPKIFNRNRIICMSLQILTSIILFLTGSWVFAVIFGIFASDQFKRIQDLKNGRLRLSHLSLDNQNFYYDFDKQSIDITNIKMFEKGFSKLQVKKIAPNWANSIKIKTTDIGLLLSLGNLPRIK